MMTILEETDVNPTSLKPEEIRQQIATIRQSLAQLVGAFPRGQAYTILLLNEKGGIGKTTLCATLLAAFADLGLRAVGIDSSIQANLTTSFNLAKAGGFYDLIIRNSEWRHVLQPVNPDAIGYDVSGELWILPGNIETRAITMLKPDGLSLYNRIFRPVSEGGLMGWADVIVADTGPEPSDIHNVLYMAAQAILFPTQCAYLSIEGLAASVLHKENAALLRGDTGTIKTLGIVPTMYRMKIEAHEEGVRQLRQRYKRLVWPPVPLRTVWEKASWVGESIFRFAPDDVAALEAWALVKRVMEAAQ